MVNESWRPLSVNDEEKIREYDALYEGVPEGVAVLFWDWVTHSLYEGGPPDEVPSREWINKRLYLKLGIDLQISLPETFPGMDDSSFRKELKEVLRRSGKGLDIADYLLAHEGNDYPDALDQILEFGKSAWTVGERCGRPGLIRRMPEGVQVAADQVMEDSGNAGLKLAQAWKALYGRSPDPAKAYSLAVKAVEDAAIPVVAPKDKDSTLGKVIKQIREQKDWNLPMAREHDEVPSTEVLLGMIQVLWAGHHDRHGGNSDLPPLTHEEAVVAVSLAVTLVHWFSTEGLVQRAKNRPC